MKVSAKEKTISAGGYSFLCIFGTHINGGFLAIPNWNICVELSEANDKDYNFCKIYDALCQNIFVTELKLSKEKIYAISNKLANEILKEGYGSE